jgi:hypothetical protein
MVFQTFLLLLGRQGLESEPAALVHSVSPTELTFGSSRCTRRVAFESLSEDFTQIQPKNFGPRALHKSLRQYYNAILTMQRFTSGFSSLSKKGNSANLESFCQY